MICPQCKKQIPDTSDQCPFCSYKINHKRQLPKEISKRRYQRWFFYGLISFMFIGMILTIVKIYSVNTELVTRMVTFEQTIKEKASALEDAKKKLSDTGGKIEELKQNLDKAQNELAEKKDKYKED